jgi:ankyrin repeat protein
MEEGEIMDFQKADYGTIIRFGTLDDFIKKLNMESQNIRDIVNNTDCNGVSLLQKALISRKFVIAKFLLNEGARVNIISNDGFNELHYIAANINIEGAIEIARLLINHGADLDHTDKKYGNTALLTLCLELLKRQTEEGLSFIEDMILKHPNMDITNKSGISTRALLKDRSSIRIKKLLGEL